MSDIDSPEFLIVHLNAAQWGDSSPLLLPCIRFRDLAIHMVIVATGGASMPDEVLPPLHLILILRCVW